MPASTQLSVTVLTSDPSAFMTSISVTEFGRLANATSVPSGDQDGMLSHHPLLVSLVSSREFGSRSQISLEFVKSMVRQAGEVGSVLVDRIDVPEGGRRRRRRRQRRLRSVGDIALRTAFVARERDLP